MGQDGAEKVCVGISTESSAPVFAEYNLPNIAYRSWSQWDLSLSLGRLRKPMAPNKGSVLLDPAVFDPAAIRPEVHTFNQKLVDIMKGAPRWYEVSVLFWQILSTE